MSQANHVNISTDINPAASTEHVQLAIEGMTCQACASRIEKVLNKKPAIAQASVNFAGETANINYDASQTNPEQIIDWVSKTGFTATVAQATLSASDQGSDKGSTALPWRLIAIWLCLLPFLPGMAGMLLGQGMAWMPAVWLQFILATIVQFVLASPFYRSAWASIKGGLANMDVLVVLGTLSIWLYSSYSWLQGMGVFVVITEAISWGDALLGIWQLLQMQWQQGWMMMAAEGHGHDMATISGAAMPHIYFEAGVMIIAFVRLGKYLEERTKKRSLNSINLLLSLTPEQVERQQVDGSFAKVALAKVQVGDVLRAKQGSRIATDGQVLSGNGWCDESHLTGESLPLNKQAGDQVLAGALVDNGSLLYRVAAKGRDTLLGDMVQALSDAQGSKANLARIADQVAAVFVPIVVAIAILTFAMTYWWFGGTQEALSRAVLHAVSVLVIACPCALGLATPAAIMAGMGVAARHGVWFKDAQSLEQAGSIDTVVLDKTGTLTIGKPTVVDNVLMDKSLSDADVLQLVASVEAHASHPLATAMVNAAVQQGIELLPVSAVDVVQGQGIQAQIEGLGLVKVGSASFANLKMPRLMPKVWQIASTVAVSVNDIPLGAFALADDLKPDSQQAVQALQADGIEVIIMSGDKTSVVSHIAETLGIDKAYGQLSPRDKAERIAALQDSGKQVAMVGDGVNDAPAMATAQASFAMHEGTDVAQHSASARLMGASLMHVDAAQKIAKATIGNIKQNLFFAFIYNCLGIPLAALGFLNPIIAAAAMALSSISVLMNALRLTRYRVHVVAQSTDTSTLQNISQSTSQDQITGNGIG